MGNRISKQKVEDLYALTPVQQGMLFHYLKNPGSEEYLEQLSIRLKGAIGMEAVKGAWAYVAECNDALRTVFRWDKLEAPVQIVLRDFEVPINTISIKGSGREAEALLDKIREEDYSHGIDISENPFRITLVELPGDALEMIITNHHILLDGWSTGIILKEFIEAYESISRGRELKNRSKMKIKEFILWLQKLDMEEQRAYWKRYLEGYEQRAVIPLYDENRQQTCQVGEYRAVLEPGLGEAIKEVCQKLRVSEATLINTAWGILLQKYNNTHDVVFGTTVSGRTAKLKGIEESAGLYINTLPLRVRSGAEEQVESLLKRVEEEIRGRDVCENIPLVEIQKASGSIMGENLFDTLLVIENYPIAQMLKEKNGSLDLEISKVREATNYDVTVGVMLGKDTSLTVIYKGGKYSLGSMERVAGHFINILRRIAENSQETIGNIKAVSEEEEKQLLYTFNNTGAPYPKDKTVYKLFEEQAERTPEQIALVYGKERMNYRELNERANKLAWHLIKKGVGPDELVGVMLDRSIEMMVGILGVLKAGGAYLPIDPRYPQKRIMQMLESSDARILLTKESTVEGYALTSLQNLRLEKEVIRHIIDHGGKLPDNNILLRTSGIAVSEERDSPKAKNGCRDILMLDHIDNLLKNEASKNPEVEIEGDNTIYQIYTSGSTGTPKGAMVKHHSFTNLVNWYNREFDINSEHRMLLIASTSFDLAQKNLYATLAVGGQLHLFEWDSYDYEKMSEVIEREGITIVNCTPSAFYPLLDVNEENSYRRLKSLKYVFLGGETINMAKLLPWMNSADYHCEVVNTYGPTECTDVISYYRIKNNDDDIKTIPIGRPVDNARLYILDKNYGIMPVGVEGELYAGGVCVGKGYYKDKALTGERFIEVDKLPDRLLYKTGDNAKWLPDGNIEFVGRADNQVKIRGFRIETGEIEAKLLKYKSIKEATVTVRENADKGKYICAYLVSEQEVETSDITAFLKNELPSYMLPSFFTRLEKLPLTPSGKVDRKALPAPLNASGINTGTELPGSELEKALAGIWCKVLNIDNVGVADNFFEIGGHSIKAIEVINKVHKLLNVKISVSDLFSHPTIRSLSGLIEGKGTSSFTEIRQLADQEYYKLSYGQKRLWVLNRLNPQSTAYNIQGSFVMNESVDPLTVEKTMNLLAERHEGLRTRFMLCDGEPVQLVDKKVRIEVPLLCSASEREQAVEQLAGQIFDLEKAPLLSVRLVKLDNQKYELLFCMHHIISDGWSMEILKKDFGDIYNACKQNSNIELKPLKIQYKDYAAWQNEMLQDTDKMEKAKAYWRSKLTGPLPEVYVARDMAYSEESGRNSAAYRWMLGEKSLKELKAVAVRHETSLFNVLLAAYAVMLSDLSDLKDVALGIAGTAREHEDLREVIGFFVNTVLVRSTIELSETFSNQLKCMHREVMAALEYQTYPLELIAQELKVKFPAIRMFFNMLNIGDSAGSFIAPFAPEHIEKVRECKFDIVVYVTEYANGLEIRCDYLTGMYKKETIVYLMERYRQKLMSISEDAGSNNPIKSDTVGKRVLKRLAK